jgi:hypothetical protein
VFYNNSFWDGNTPGVNGTVEDYAIATNKQALLPGQTATLANYTSYSGGINGVIVDVAGLWPGLTAADFDFKVGNTVDVSTWTTVPPTPTVAVRAGDGVSGSSRVVLIWPDGAMKNTWLRVTVSANDRTGLTSPDVFYFGNLVGESYIDASTGRINAFDSATTRQHWGETATVTNLYDHNRDGSVGSADSDIVTGNLGAQLILLTAP